MPWGIIFSCNPAASAVVGLFIKRWVDVVEVYLDIYVVRLYIYRPAHAHDAWLLLWNIRFLNAFIYFIEKYNTLHYCYIYIIEKELKYISLRKQKKSIFLILPSI